MDLPVSIIEVLLFLILCALLFIYNKESLTQISSDMDNLKMILFYGFWMLLIFIMSVVAYYALNLLVMAGFMGWMVFFTGSERFYFTIINSTMPIILLTIANSDGVHFVAKFFKEMRNKKDVKKSLEATMGALLVPIFLTSLTTITAFSSLSFAPIKQLMGYGICISVGIAYAFILSSTFLPAVFLIKKWYKKSKAVTQESIFEKMTLKRLHDLIKNMRNQHFPQKNFLQLF